MKGGEMSEASAAQTATRTRFLVVAAALFLCLLLAGALALGWQRVDSFGGDRLRSSEEVPYLGITYVPLSHDLAARYGVEMGTGVLVTDVAESSPARRAGVRRGDILLSADSESFTRPSSLVELLFHRRPGDKVSFQLLREGQTLAVELTLGVRP